MNLEESELFSNELIKNNRQKKLVLMIIVLLSVILVILIAATIVVATNEAKRFKLYYNGSESKKLAATNFLIQKDGDYYINVKTMATIEGYAYNPGEYKKFEETKEACNVQKDCEITSLIANKGYYYKTIDKSISETYNLMPYGKDSSDEEVKPDELVVNTESGSVETFETDEKVILEDGELYAPVSIISDTFNVRITVTNNSISFESLNYLYAKALTNAPKNGYDTIDGTFENVRALVYDLVVVIEGATQEGVVSTIDYKPVISSQYSALTFLQNSKEFLATADKEGKRTVGLITYEGKTIIKPTEYDDIRVLSDKNGLYLVKKGTQSGVLNRDGEIVVFVEQDKIGLSDLSDFPLEDQTNGSVLFDKYIPIQRDKKFGLYNIYGVETLKPYYDSIGYKVPEEEENRISARETNVLSIPASLGIKGLVVNLNGNYGIYDMTEESLVLPCSFERIYAETISGKTTYYVVEIGQEDPINLEELIDAYGLRNGDENGNPLKKSKGTEMDYRVENGNVNEVEKRDGSNTPVNEIVNEEPEEYLDDSSEEYYVVE